MPAIHDFINAIETCETSNQAWLLLIEFIRERGFAQASYSYAYAKREVSSAPVNNNPDTLKISMAGKSWITSIPAEIVEAYRMKRAKNLDASKNYLVSSNLTPTFMGLESLDVNNPDYDIQFEFVNHFHQNGLKSFFLIPIKHLFGRNNGDVSLFSKYEFPELQKNIPEHFTNECHIAALYMHTKYQYLMRKEYAAELGIKGRPFEVLQKLNSGFTNSQIADIMGVSQPTVSFHLKELRDTLKISSTREILPTALRHGLLDN